MHSTNAEAAHGGRHVDGQCEDEADGQRPEGQVEEQLLAIASGYEHHGLVGGPG